MNVSFKTMQLIVDNLAPTETILESINSSPTKSINIGDISYIFTTKYNKEEKYLWMYGQFENSKIRNEFVYDKFTYEAEKNPRNNNQIEYKHQLFAMYFISNKTLYLSNLQKKEQFAKYLSDVLQKEVIIKSYYKGINEFVEGIKTLKKLSFTTKHDLFTERDGIFETVANIFGLDCAEAISIEADYKRMLVSDIGQKFFSRIKNQKDNDQIDNIVLCGYDDNDIEKTLDINNYVESISINAVPDEKTGLLTDDMIELLLKTKLKEGKYV